jgi:ABC-2 type transport system ATP-binding protein
VTGPVLAETSAARAGATSDECPLVLDRLERRWGEQPILQGANLRLEAGTTAWLGGANGVGKTTLLRVTSGLITAHGGTVRLCGLDPQRDRREFQRRLGYLSAGDRGLYARLTVTQNLEFWAGLTLIPRAARTTFVGRAIARFDLREMAGRRVDRLSMGQRQRVRLAMTFLHEPTVVLLDEPHTSLDDPTLDLLDAAIAELTARGGAVLWCSPAAAQLPLRADLRYLLVDGEVRPQ